MIGEVKITQSDNSMNCAVKVNSRSSRKSEVKTTFLKKKKKKKKKKKNFGCAESSLLFEGFLYSCGNCGLLFIVVCGPLVAVASVAKHRP